MRIILILLFTISTSEGGSLEDYIKNKNPKLSEQTIQIISTELKKYPKQITYVTERESTFNPDAKSKGCVGLMGVRLKTWFSSDPDYNLIKLGILASKEEIYTIEGNLKAGHFILEKYRWNYRRYRGLL